MPRKPAVKKVAKKVTKARPAKPAKPTGPTLTKAQMAEHVGWLLVYSNGNGIALLQPTAMSSMVVRVRGLSVPGALPYALDVAKVNDTVLSFNAHKTEKEKQGLFALTRREVPGGLDRLGLLAFDRSGKPTRFGLADAKRVEKAKVTATPWAKRSAAAYRARAMVDSLCNVWSFGR